MTEDRMVHIVAILLVGYLTYHLEIPEEEEEEEEDDEYRCP